ncbi:MAG: hypothetical protein HOK72_02265 [Flavobacteriales bacterium]|nr:hypothetical protein [Flavobacteriales bacterium]
MKKLLIKNIKELVQVEYSPKTRVLGHDMKNLPTLKNAWLAVEDDTIIDFGSMDEMPGITDWNDLEVIDAEGKLVFPSWCDSHTHIVFAGTRETEFVDRINGLSYEEIASRGGGILNSAEKLANTSEDDLVDSAMNRLNEIMYMGTGAVEIKSGYGLSIEAELKILRVIKRLKQLSPLTIKANFLGAHAIPKLFKENRAGYIDQIINDMLPVIEKEGLAEGLQGIEGGISLHIACHARAQNMGQKANDLLKHLPGAEVSVVERCSGHGGIWGVMKDNFDVALKVGKPVARKVAQSSSSYVVSECPLAREHIVQGIEALDEDVSEIIPLSHPIQLIAKAYGLIESGG